MFVTPVLQKVRPDLPGFNMLSAGLVIGLMIVPYVSSVSEAPFAPSRCNFEKGSYAMGATRCRLQLRGRVPAAFSGFRRLHSGDLARGRRDHGRRDRRRHAAQLTFEPARAGGHHHRLHRAGQSRRPAARQRRLPNHFRHRTNADADHARLQHRRPCT